MIATATMYTGNIIPQPQGALSHGGLSESSKLNLIQILALQFDHDKIKL